MIALKLFLLHSTVGEKTNEGISSVANK